ncbi:response regulator [Nibricoccus aquaticus]|nr:response regulator transcription factor [Nibricoccus aquaticus]
MGPGKTSALTVFIAEDHVAIREVLALFLNSKSHIQIVGESSDGHEVVAQCLKLKPRLLLLDIDLPGLNGISIARNLTLAQPETQILIFSSHNDAATIRMVLEAGVRGIIEKTSRAETLLQAIEIVGSGKAYFGEKITQALQQAFIDPATTRTPGTLTPREHEVLQLIAEGFSNKEVSTKLGISVKTAENHRHHIMEKLGAHNAADLTREAFSLGLVRTQSRPGFQQGKPAAGS